MTAKGKKTDSEKKTREVQNAELAGESPVDVVPPSAETSKKQTTGVVSRSADKSNKRRIGFPLTDSGAIDWESMHGKTKTELETVLRTDSTVIAFHRPPAELSERLDEKTAGAILDGISAAERVVFGKLFHLTARQAEQIFNFPPAAHEQLDPALVAVANKHADRLPDWLVKYKEEFVLAMALGKITFAQCMAALVLSKRQQQIEREAAERQAEQEQGARQAQVI